MILFNLADPLGEMTLEEGLIAQSTRHSQWANQYKSTNLVADSNDAWC